MNSPCIASKPVKVSQICGCRQAAPMEKKGNGCKSLTPFTRFTDRTLVYLVYPFGAAKIRDTCIDPILSSTPKDSIEPINYQKLSCNFNLFILSSHFLAGRSWLRSLYPRSSVFFIMWVCSYSYCSAVIKGGYFLVVFQRCLGLNTWINQQVITHNKLSEVIEPAVLRLGTHQSWRSHKPKNQTQYRKLIRT